MRVVGLNPTFPTYAVRYIKMKIIKGKIIRLTESELHAIIKEAVTRELDYLMEYKAPRKDLVKAASNFCGQLLSHWCCIRFFTITNIPTTDIAHWRGEVIGAMNNIAKVHLKGNMDDFSTRKKAIEEGFEVYDLLTDPSNIYGISLEKLIGEGIDIDKYAKEIEQVNKECFEEIPKLIDMMARHDSREISLYVRSF